MNDKTTKPGPRFFAWVPALSTFGLGFFMYGIYLAAVGNWRGVLISIVPGYLSILGLFIIYQYNFMQLWKFFERLRIRVEESTNSGADTTP